MAQEILVNVHNHFDTTWRRCFDRSAVYNGVTIRGYAEIEDHCISRWLELAPRGYTYTEGQAAVWRKYLEHHPERKGELQKYARDGLFEMVLAGEVIPDTNMPAAEGLVRNFLCAMPFCREIVGRDHPGLKIGWLFDAFGNSPNMPQLFKLVGAEAVGMLTYCRCEDYYWEGIDGTALAVNELIAWTGGGQYEKHPPCGACKGAGCGTCDETGIDFVKGFDLVKIREDLEKAAGHADEWVELFEITEELRPDPGIVDVIEEFNRAHAGECAATFATSSQTILRLAAELAARGRPRSRGGGHDLNPAMPGCYVTRIRTKQRTRAITYKLVAAEAILADATWQDGAPAVLPTDMAAAWQRVAFNQFHDAITGTHIDSAHIELMEMLDEAEEIVDARLDAAQESAPSVFTGAEQVTSVTLGPYTLGTERAGIVTVTRDGVDLFGPVAPLNRIRGPLHIGELWLEPDFGDAWGQRIPPFPSLDQGLAGVPLGGYHTSMEIADGAVRWKGMYNGGDPQVDKLTWTVTVTQRDGRLEFRTDVDWDTSSRRLRAFFPVPSQEKSALWEVPFGHIERTFEPEKLDYSQWRANTMEFAALHWVAKPLEKGGVVLFNKGLPCWRWMPGHFDVSLLRSPESNFSAVELHHYEFWDIDGQRDTGRHSFEYALYPYGKDVSVGDLTRMGYTYNMPRSIDPPFNVSGDVVVTAWKPAEDGDGWILRLQEASGRGTTTQLVFDTAREVTLTNLLEEPLADSLVATEHRYELHQHEILTVLIRVAPHGTG